MGISHDQAEKWFPIYVRVLGSILGVMLVVATIFGRAGIEFAGAWAFVTGMILYKNVHDFQLGRSDDRRNGPQG